MSFRIQEWDFLAAERMSNDSGLPVDFSQFNYLTNIAHWIYRIWTIPFVMVGLVGNLLALIIFMRWARHLSVYVYLSVLCVVNMCIVVCDICLNHFIPYILSRHQLEERFLPVLCRYNFFVIYFLRYMFIWLLTCVNIDRSLFLDKKSRARILLCHPRSAALVCGGLIILASIFNVHFLIFCTKEPVLRSHIECYLDGLLCQCQNSNSAYSRFWKFGWPAANLFVFALGPFAVILVCLIRIVRHAKCIQREIRRDRSNSGVSTGISQRHQLPILCRTLVCLDLLFPLTIFPTLFLHIYVSYVPPYTCRSIGILNVFFAIGSACTFIKNAFTFGIYYLSGAKFRRVVKHFARRTSSTPKPMVPIVAIPHKHTDQIRHPT